VRGIGHGLGLLRILRALGDAPPRPRANLVVLSVEATMIGMKEITAAATRRVRTRATTDRS